MVSVAGAGREANDVSVGASVSIPPVRKSSKLHAWPSIVLSCSWDRSTVCVHTNMHVVSVGFFNPPNYDMDYRVFKMLIF